MQPTPWKSGRCRSARSHWPCYAELLWQALTAKIVELLKAMCGAGAMSIREAARRVGRDVKGVRGDVVALLDAGGPVVRLREALRSPFEAVKVEFMLEAA